MQRRRWGRSAAAGDGRSHHRAQLGALRGAGSSSGSGSSSPVSGSASGSGFVRLWLRSFFEFFSMPGSVSVSVSGSGSGSGSASGAGSRCSRSYYRYVCVHRSLRESRLAVRTRLDPTQAGSAHARRRERRHGWRPEAKGNEAGCQRQKRACQPSMPRLKPLPACCRRSPWLAL